MNVRANGGDGVYAYGGGWGAFVGDENTSTGHPGGGLCVLEPSAEPDRIDTTGADYIVGPGQLATVTTITGAIEGYDGGAVNARPQPLTPPA